MKDFQLMLGKLGIDQESARCSSPTISKYGGIPTECRIIHGELCAPKSIRSENLGAVAIVLTHAM